MDISGKLIKILPEQRGESQRGPWVKGSFVIETDGEFPRQACFILFGEDRLAMVKNIPLNTSVIVTFSVESREYNERWYTDLRCIRVQPANGAMPQAATGYATTPQPAAPVAEQPFASVPTEGLQNDDDLPF